MPDRARSGIFFLSGSARVSRARFGVSPKSIGITQLICCSARRGAEQAGRLRYPVTAPVMRQPIGAQVLEESMWLGAYRNKIISPAFSPRLHRADPPTFGCRRDSPNLLPSSPSPNRHCLGLANRVSK